MTHLPSQEGPDFFDEAVECLPLVQMARPAQPLRSPSHFLGDYGGGEPWMGQFGLHPFVAETMKGVLLTRLHINIHVHVALTFP